MEDMGVFQSYPYFYVNFRISSVMYPISYILLDDSHIHQGPGGSVHWWKLTRFWTCNEFVLHRTLIEEYQNGLCEDINQHESNIK